MYECRCISVGKVLYICNVKRRVRIICEETRHGLVRWAELSGLRVISLCKGVVYGERVSSA